MDLAGTEQAGACGWALNEKQSNGKAVRSPCGRVGLSGPERDLSGRYRVRPSRKRDAQAKWETANLCPYVS